jgi:hypothetical protein
MTLFSLAERFFEKYFVKSAKEYKPEAPKSAPFGEYAWASHRHGLPEEPDTELEKQTYKDIRNHFASKHVGLPKLTVRLLVKILAKEWYQEVLHPPKHETLYRGLKLSRKELADLLDQEDFEDSGSIKWGKPVKVYNGHSTSWTYKKTISKDFSGDYGKAKNGFAVTLIAKVKSNPNRFLAGPGGLYDVDGLSRWHLEKETVGLEPIEIEKIEWEKL